MQAIEVDRIRKRYGELEALRGVSFSVPRGEIFGIIGPDGAGKTTLFRILTTVLLADEGTARVDGLDVVKDFRRIRDRVGYMPGRFSLYQDLSVEENLQFFASIFHTTVRENYHLVSDIYSQLEPFRKRRAGALSGGMKQKLALCCALIHKPSVLFLDEPTTGVDPVSRKEFWDMLRRLKEQQITILVSTPYMDEASLCDRLALMHGGQFLTIDTPQGIVGAFGRDLWAVRASRMPQLLEELRAWEATQTCFAFGDTHHLTFDPAKGTIDQLKKRLREKDYDGLEIKRIEPSVEDCYMQLEQQGKPEKPQSDV